MAKKKFTVKKFDHLGANAYAIFRRRDVRNIEEVVRYSHGIDPVGGYSSMTKDLADVVAERLERESKYTG